MEMVVSLQLFYRLAEKTTAHPISPHNPSQNKTANSGSTQNSPFDTSEGKRHETLPFVELY